MIGASQEAEMEILVEVSSLEKAALCEPRNVPGRQLADRRGQTYSPASR
jgi:hypothetical protein